MMEKNRKIIRLAIIVTGILISLIPIAAVILLVNYPAEYLRRVITYQMSDVYDYQIFPEQAIQPASKPIPFRPSAHPKEDEARIEGWLELEPDGSYGYEAQGSYGQHLFVYPEKHIIIVRNGETSGITEEEWIGGYVAFAKKVNLSD